MPGAPPPADPPDPQALLRSRGYVQILILAAITGLPISAAAYGFLALVDHLQDWLFTDLPETLGYDAAPTWWPLPLLAISGVLTAAAIRRLPGTGGHHPAEGFKAGGALPPVELPGVVLAALATLSFGAVLGPEAPLIAVGSGLGVLAVRLAARDAPPMAATVIAAAGSFASISTLLGSPLLGSFLLLEASGLGGPLLGVVLVPGLLAAGVGTLIFVGLDSITGLGTFSLSLPDVPAFDRPTVAMFGWAIVIGLVAPLLGLGIRQLARSLRPVGARRLLVMLPLVGIGVGALAACFAAVTDHPASDVLFSGQDQLPSLIAQASEWSVGALLLLIACKGLAYALSLSAFRGGPVFPAMFLGAAGGIAASHLPGLSLVPAIAMGIGAMSCTMLGLPLTSVVLATVLVSSDSLNVISLVIVSVVVTHVLTARLAPAPDSAPEPAPAAA